MVKASSELIRCRGCGTPLAKVGAGKIHIIKYHKGNPIEVTVEVRHRAGGVIAVECEKCRGRITPHYFVTLVAPARAP